MTNEEKNHTIYLNQIVKSSSDLNMFSVTERVATIKEKISIDTSSIHVIVFDIDGHSKKLLQIFDYRSLHTFHFSMSELFNVSIVNDIENHIGEIYSGCLTFSRNYKDIYKG